MPGGRRNVDGTSEMVFGGCGVIFSQAVFWHAGGTEGSHTSAMLRCSEEWQVPARCPRSYSAGLLKFRCFLIL